MLWGLFRRGQTPLIKKNALIEIDGKPYKVKRVKNSTTLHIKDNFVPWWQGFNAYWRSWYHWSWVPAKLWESGQRIQAVVGWAYIFRTPLFMVHIAKRSRSCNRDGYESGIRVHWFPKRWSLRLREAEVMYRHTWEWMSFIPTVAIRGLR